MREQGRTAPHQCRGGTEQRATGAPRHQCPGQAAAGKLTDDGTGGGGREDCAADALGGRAQQCAAAINRGEHDMHDVGCFQRDWPTLRAAAQTGQEAEADDQAEYGRRVLRELGGSARGNLLVLDRGAEP